MHPGVVVERHEVVVPVVALGRGLEGVGEVGADLVPHVVDRRRQALRREEPHAEPGEPGEQVVRGALQVVVDVVLERVVVDRVDGDLRVRVRGRESGDRRRESAFGTASE